MSKEIIIFVILLIAIGFSAYNIQNTIQSQFEYGCTKDAKELDFPIGQRVYSPSYRLYGMVDSLREDCSVLGINWDNSRISQQGVTDYIKVNGTYLDIEKYPNNGTLPELPCDNPKSEVVARACVEIMEARFANN